MQTFAFNAGDPGSYESMKRRQALAEAMLFGRRRAPRNTAEGIYSALSDIGSGLQARSARKGTEGLRDSASDFALGTFGRIDGAGGDFPPVPDAPGAVDAPSSGGAGADPDLVAYIRESATQRDVDPDIALKVAYSEGLTADPAEAWQSTIVDERGREPSYTPFQLLVGGPGTGFPTGMGNDFIKATGLDPRDPKNVKAAIDFALDQAKKGGWGPWYGAAKVGVGRWDGLRAPSDQGASLDRDVPRNMVASLGDAGVADALRAADEMEGVQVADASGLMKRIQTSDMNQLQDLVRRNQSTMTAQEVDAARKRAYELQGMEVPADAAPIPGIAPAQPQTAQPARPITPTPPAPAQAAPQAPVARGGALPPTISPSMDERMQGAPPLEAPRTIEGRTVAGVESTGNPKLDRFNEFVRKSGSKQLASADPTKGLLGVLTGMAKPGWRPGFPPRPGAGQLTAENAAVASINDNPYVSDGKKRVAEAMLNTRGGSQPSANVQQLASAMTGQRAPMQFASLDPANDFRTALAQPQGAGVLQGIPTPPTPANDAQPVQTAQARQLTPQDVRDLIRIMNNPASSPGDRATAQYYLQQHQARQMTPLQQLQLEKARRELNTPPKRETAKDANGRLRYIDTGELAFPDLEVEPEYRDLTPEEIKVRRLDPNSAWQIGRDNRIYKAGGGGVTVNVGGGKFAGKLGEEAAKTVMEQYESTRDAASLIGTINEGRALLDEGILTGATADWRVAATKYAQLVGIPVDPSMANNAEAFQSVMAQAVAKIIKQFGAGTGLSDADREYAKKMAAGDVNLNEAAIRRIFDVTEKMARARIRSWEERIPEIMKGNLEEVLSIPEPGAYVSPLPEGVTEEDITHTMEVHGLTREEVLERLK